MVASTWLGGHQQDYSLFHGDGRNDRLQCNNDNNINDNDNWVHSVFIQSAVLQGPTGITLRNDSREATVNERQSILRRT